MDTSDRPARLTVGVLGAGRVGSVLGAALAQAGHRVVAASGVSDASQRRANDLLGIDLSRPDEVMRRAELILLTVPDDVLPGLVSGLAATGADLRGKLLMHASGAYGLGVLQPATDLGALPPGAPPGDDLHRARRRLRAAQRLRPSG